MKLDGDSPRLNILREVLTERERNSQLPGSEFDMCNTPNDWVAIASRYLSEHARRGTNTPDEREFRDALIKAAAVVLAALEHVPVMTVKGHLHKS